MVLRTLFFTSIFYALHEDFSLDLSVLLCAVLFPRKRRRCSTDLLLVLGTSLLLGVLHHYSLWRQWYPLVLPEFLIRAAQTVARLFSDRISVVTSGAYEQFLKAVLLAQKKGLSEQTIAMFQGLGISHVLAVSGFHIGFWVVLTRPLLFWAKRPKTKLFAHFLQFLLLFFYAQMVGASSSVLRAVWMFGVARFAALQQKKIPALHIPMLVAVGHFIINPDAPKSLSFQLSYTAVFAILMALQYHKNEALILHYSYKRSNRFGSIVFVPFQISLAAWSATLPLVQRSFGGSSPYFLVGNLVFVPMITIMIWASVPLLLGYEWLPEIVITGYNTVWDTLLNQAGTTLLRLQELRQAYG